jgi:hypothetical protein
MDDDEPLVTSGPHPGRGWLVVTRGAHRTAEATDLWTAVLQAWQLALPESAVFTHLTAARIRGWWLAPLPDDLPVFAAMPVDANRPRRRGLVVLRPKAAPECCAVNSVRCASAPEIILACARDLEILDLVVVIDSALHSGDCTLAELESLAGARRRGAPRLRLALTMCDGRSESAWETLLRILHVVCEVPVEPQHEITDETGLFVARGDLWLVGTKTLHEYDGGDHLERRRQRQDLGRARRLGHADWERRGYTREDVLHQAVRILRDADASLGRPHEPQRIRVWHELLRESMFSPAGIARIRRRLGLAPETGQLEAG